MWLHNPATGEIDLVHRAVLECDSQAAPVEGLGAGDSCSAAGHGSGSIGCGVSGICTSFQLAMSSSWWSAAHRLTSFGTTDALGAEGTGFAPGRPR